MRSFQKLMWTPLLAYCCELKLSSKQLQHLISQ